MGSKNLGVQSTNAQKVKYFIDIAKNGSFIELTDAANKLTGATQSITNTVQDYKVFGSIQGESEVTYNDNVDFAFVGRTDISSDIYNQILLPLNLNTNLGAVNNVPFKYEIYNDEGVLVETTTYPRTCITMSSFIGGEADTLMEYNLELKTSSSPDFVEAPAEAKTIPTGVINSLTPSVTSILVNYDVTDPQSAISGNLRIDVEVTASLGAVVSTTQANEGTNLEETLTGLIAATPYTVFLRCDYDDTVNTPVIDFELDTDTVTTEASAYSVNSDKKNKSKK